MMFEVVGSFIALFLFLFSYIQLKKIRHQETTTYFDGLDGIHASVTHDSGGDM
ncbi:ABC transporter permease [Bacillus sp. LK2]|nr:ABC transporter permease [Bacillus sp. LK2]